MAPRSPASPTTTSSRPRWTAGSSSRTAASKRTRVQRSRRDASHLRAADLVALAGLGLRIRRLRAALSALGICIGIAAIVGVLGITQSSESDLVAQIDQLGTNLLTLQNGRDFNGAEGTLPQAAPAMIGRVAGVEHCSRT